jgi:exoribonuclease II
VTSPLRRHSDMVAHWQIKHALLHPESSKPLFSPEWLQEYGTELITREKMYQKAQVNHTYFWALRFIQRWKESTSRPDGHDPLAHLVGYISSTPMVNHLYNDVQTSIMLPELGLRGFLTGLRGRLTDAGRTGQAVDVQIKEIRVAINSQLVVGIK